MSLYDSLIGEFILFLSRVQYGSAIIVGEYGNVWIEWAT